jgi:hypothetical protein
MKKNAMISLLLMSAMFNAGSKALAQCPQSAEQTVTATLTRTIPPPGPGPTPGPTPATGGIVAGGVGAAAAGAGAFAFAPLLLAGLAPNGVVSAAAPIGCLPCQESLLQAAIMKAFCTDDLNCAVATMNSNGKYYIAINNTAIRNGSFDMQGLVLPKELACAKKLKVNITMASEAYKLADGEPELALGLYKNIGQKDLSKKFETQQFMHHYLMKKYEVPMTITDKSYGCGIQKLTAIICPGQLCNATTMPLQTVVKFTENGFRKGMHTLQPKVKFYAYLIEIEKIS